MSVARERGVTMSVLLFSTEERALSQETNCLEKDKTGVGWREGAGARVFVLSVENSFDSSEGGSD